MKWKYIRHNSAGFFLWHADGLVLHSQIAQAVQDQRRGHIVSAGFVNFHSVLAQCHGDSASLRVSADPGDGRLLNALLTGTKPGPT
jgi:hypothetical protein